MSIMTKQSNDNFGEKQSAGLLEVGNPSQFPMAMKEPKTEEKHASAMINVSTAPRPSQCAIAQIKFSTMCVPTASGLPKIHISKAATNSHVSRRFKTRISCSLGEAETLQVVQEIIAKQLSIEESSVSAQTKFAELGADSLDTVEIMMALEEKFGVSIGESGAENISTVQDAADLIHNVKASSSS
ncbi:hypothetical protein M9H77_05123 [Catharanthus roseus]|uniref:Uncharacterized protein n=1 Tax=Catharanthus roseus TaxID=4058 RepID=A0ACC0CG72_CATRO|nr:hypothetical protein M9H77_05123 [Catharanthus roseus]